MANNDKIIPYRDNRSAHILVHSLDVALLKFNLLVPHSVRMPSATRALPNFSTRRLDEILGRTTTSTSIFLR